MERYYILDCKDNIIGNPKGYRTHRGAFQQATMKGSKIKAIAWQRLETVRKCDPKENLIYRIIAR